MNEMTATLLVVLLALLFGLALGWWITWLWLSRPELTQRAWDDGYAAGFRLASEQQGKVAAKSPAEEILGLVNQLEVRVPSRVCAMFVVPDLEGSKGS